MWPLRGTCLQAEHAFLVFAVATLDIEGPSPAQWAAICHQNELPKDRGHRFQAELWKLSRSASGPDLMNSCVMRPLKVGGRGKVAAHNVIHRKHGGCQVTSGRFRSGGQAAAGPRPAAPCCQVQTGVQYKRSAQR